MNWNVLCNRHLQQLGRTESSGAKHSKRTDMSRSSSSAPAIKSERSRSKCQKTVRIPIILNASVNSSHKNKTKTFWLCTLQTYTPDDDVWTTRTYQHEQHRTSQQRQQNNLNVPCWQVSESTCWCENGCDSRSIFPLTFVTWWRIQLASICTVRHCVFWPSSHCSLVQKCVTICRNLLRFSFRSRVKSAERVQAEVTSASAPENTSESSYRERKIFINFTVLCENYL